jgi:hypothetical protein
MARKLRYAAQAFTRGQPGPVYPFLCALDAEAGAEILARSADGAIAYQVWVDADADAHDEPELLATLGSVPSGARAIDADGREPWLDDAA